MEIRVTSRKSLKEHAVSIVKEYVASDAPIEIIGDEEDFRIKLVDAALAPEQVSEIRSRMRKMYTEHGRVMAFESQDTSGR